MKQTREGREKRLEIEKKTLSNKYIHVSPLCNDILAVLARDKGNKHNFYSFVNSLTYISLKIFSFNRSDNT